MPDYSGEPKVVTRVLKSGKVRQTSRVRHVIMGTVRAIQCEDMPFAFKME